MPTTARFDFDRNESALAMPVKTPVHVACAANAAYIMPLCVMLASLVEHFDPTRELVLHLISNEATAEDREKVRRTVVMNRPGLVNIAIHWYGIDPGLTRGLSVPTGTHFTIDTYTRILAPVILPEDCTRIIYLDCDLIVLADLARLYDAATGSTVLHAAQEVGTPWVSSSSGVFDYRERGIPADTRYFNGGVLVIDLQRWRARGLTPALLEYMTRHGDRIFAVDQGALNAFLHDDWTPLDLRWNQGFAVLFPDLWAQAGYSRQEWRRVRDEPWIVHYSGAKKPWNRAFSPRRTYFYEYLKKTVFRDVVPQRPGLEKFIGRRAYYHLWRWARQIPGLVQS